MFRLYSDLIAEMQGLEPEHFHVIRPVTKIVTKLVPHSRNLLRHKKAIGTLFLGVNSRSGCSPRAAGAVFMPGRAFTRAPTPGHSYQSVVH
jgi:hypothetical protein